MTIEARLREYSSALIVRDSERESIKVSTSTIINRLLQYFGSQIKANVFGSYARYTMLPRSFDAQSDVDIMVIFKSEYNYRPQYKPQTYLNKLKRFGLEQYRSSIVEQDFPAIRFELNHIIFELVPAIQAGDLYIPDKNYEWIQTDPERLNNQVQQTNQSLNNLILPTIRIIKNWNIQRCNRSFSSYEIEQHIASGSWLTSSNNTRIELILNALRLLRRFSTSSTTIVIDRTIEKLNCASIFDCLGSNEATEEYLQSALGEY